MRVLLLCLTGCWVSLSATQAQNGWTRARNHWFVKIDASVFRSDTYHNPEGGLVKGAVFTQRSVNLYAEYGVTDRFTAILSWPALRTHAFERTETVFGISDVRLEGKYRLTNNAWPVSLAIAAEIPTGRANALAENDDLPGNFINLPTGDGEFNVWTTLAASRSFGSAYASVFTAYDIRTTYDGMAFQDLYQFGGELGWNLWKPLWLIGKMRAQYNTGDSESPSLGFLRGDATEFTQYSVELSYRFLPKWGASFCFSDVNDLVAPLKNLYAAPTFSVGVFFSNE